MTQQAAAFFSPWDPPPALVQPPQDAGLVQRITKLAEFAARNGPSFVEMMRERQRENPEYTFLHGGDGADFYRWTLYCKLYNHPADQPLPGQAAAPAAGQQQAQAQQAATDGAVPAQSAQHAAPAAPAAPAPAVDTSAVLATLPAEVSSGFRQVLDLLHGSRDSIRASQAWFMACVPYADGMAEMMLQYVLASTEYAKQQHVVYLANDVLFKALAQRAEGAGPSGDAVAQAFQPRLGRMLARAYETGGKTEQVQQGLARVVNFWAERGVYDQPTVEQFTMEMLGVTLPAPQQAQQPAGEQPAAAAPAPAQDAAAAPAAPADPIAAAVAAAKAAAMVTAAALSAAAGVPPPAGAPAPQAAAQPGVQAALAAGYSSASAPQQQQPSGYPPAGQAPYPPSAGQHQWQQAAQQPYPPHQQQPYAQHAQQAQQFYPHQQQQQQPYQAAGQPGAYPLPPGSYGQPGGPAPYPAGPGQPAGQYYPPPGQQAPPGSYPPPPGGYAPPPGSYPPSQQQQGQQGAAAGYYPPPPGAPPGSYPPPGQGAPPGPGGAPYYPPPPAPAAEPEPEPEKEPFDPMSFPPGLIPRLVDALSKTDPPYSPLSPLEIERTGVPPPPNMDAYLKSRVDKFYAQLQDYRPGMLFSDLEVDVPRRKHFADAAREAPARGGLGAPGAAPLDDGSAPGLGGGGRAAGLGYGGRGSGEPHSAAGGPSASAVVQLEAPTDVFASYRNQRSRGYHDMIIRSAANKFG